MIRLAPFACAVLALLPALASAADTASRAQSILEENCLACHGAAMQMSGLDLRSHEKILRGGERGPAVKPGELDGSLLWKFVNHDAKPEMPPGRKLADDELAALSRWILEGAPLPDSTATDEEAQRAEALRKLEDRPITEEERQWWAYQPVRRKAPPAQSKHPVDAFLLAKLEEEGLQPTPLADKRTLVRRAYLDLTGLPPSPTEIREFLTDESPGAWERLIERLLASPHYGERWGRHWLDLVHYADSGGYERDFDWPNMYCYRDYVIAAFNSDKPYDRFILEQLAGDEIAPDSPEANIATGYLRLVMDNNIKDERTRLDELDDYVATAGLTFLGATIGCARCHDHKFDPFPQKDYYSIQAVFFSTKEVDYPLVPAETVERHRAANAEIDAKQKPLKKQLEEMTGPYREAIFQEKLAALPVYYQTAWKTPEPERTEGQRLNAEQVEQLRKRIPAKEIQAAMPEDAVAEAKELQEEIAQLDRSRPEPYPTARTIADAGRDPLPSYFLHRGDAGSKGSLMEPGVLSVAHRGEWEFSEPPPEVESTWRRKQFAEWIASPENPLTARVMVNRIWQHHFGHGIVRTPSNFGVTGQRPSHPELLDWLAAEFVDKGWSVKQMHRLMMTSEAYRRSSKDQPANLAKDPDNRFFWRMPRTRLEAEIIRDQMLSVAGALDLALGGPGVFPYIDPDLFQSSTDRTWPGKPIGDPSTWRRSVYVFSKRSIRYPMFEAFDQPDMVNSCAERNRSTVAPQALLLMNNAEVALQAKLFAKRLAREAGDRVEDQVRRGFELALGRPPSEAELARSAAFVQRGADGLTDFCQALFNLNEFVHRQ